MIWGVGCDFTALRMGLVLILIQHRCASHPHDGEFALVLLAELCDSSGCLDA